MADSRGLRATSRVAGTALLIVLAAHLAAVVIDLIGRW